MGQVKAYTAGAYFVLTKLEIFGISYYQNEKCFIENRDRTGSEQMASIRDVAKRANVAACTVSRVLNGTANVAPETRMKIEQAMKELNYIPNELARSMFKQKAGIVAMLVPDIRHPYFSSLARHIEDELYKNDCKLMLCSTGDDPEREKEYMKILRSNIVDGVIMGVNNQKRNNYSETSQKSLNPYQAVMVRRR